MDLERQNWKDFLLEHYSQVNQHLRECDRNRNIILQVYFVIFIGMLSFAYSTTTDWLKIIVPVFLFVFGLFIAHYVTYARAWHCEYTRVAKAIHKSFLNTDLRLYNAAKQIKEEEEEKERGRYFNPRGTEFIIASVVWLSMTVEIFLFSYETLLQLPHSSLSSQFLAIISLIVMVGLLGFTIWRYKHHLDRRQDEFPDSWCILKDDRFKKAQEE